MQLFASPIPPKLDSAMRQRGRRHRRSRFFRSELKFGAAPPPMLHIRNGDRGRARGARAADPASSKRLPRPTLDGDGQDQPAQQIAEVVGDEFLALPDDDNPLCG